MTITWDEVLSGTDLVDELVPPPMPKLKALLTEPTVFDESTNFRGVPAHPVGPEPLRARPQTDAEAVFDAHLTATGRSQRGTTGFAQWCFVCDVPLNHRERSKEYGGKCEKHAKTASCRGCLKAIVPFYNGDSTRPKEFCDKCKADGGFDIKEAGVPTAEQEYTDEPLEPVSDGGASEDLLSYGGFGQTVEDPPERPDGYRDSYFAGADLVENKPSIGDILQENGFGAHVYDGLVEPAPGKRVVFERGPFQAPEMARPRIVDEDEDLTDAERRERAAELFGIDPSTMTEDRLEGLQ